ncbi:MAG TPA: zinc-dependent alcohol dehydrogenase [Gemmatimonadaceae bacterium]|nr:zinc-dependent alcohol dehydrogenase [Gemmatimonadaceae bacterium]
MRAVTWHGTNDVRVETLADPSLVNPRDAIVRVSATAICGSDLHLYDGLVPSMKPGDVLGHEFMGEVVEVGREVRTVSRGDRVVVPFPISCGYCQYCRTDRFALCDNSNPNAWMLEAQAGYGPAGIFGYSHMYGGYAGGQAEYVRVPFADVGPLVVPEELSDEQVLFLSDVLPTGYQAAELCGIQPGDIVAVWGCGPVGQFAIRSAFLLGAARVFAIDRFVERLALAEQAGAETLDYEHTDDLVEALKQLTAGRGPDHCIDAVGMEAHGHSVDARMDRVKQAMRLEMDRANVLRQAIQACGKGGTVSVAGVYAGPIDKFPYGAAFAKGLQLRGGQCHVHRYMRPLLELVARGAIDPVAIITHRVGLEDAPAAYATFKHKTDGCVKVVMRP